MASAPRLLPLLLLPLLVTGSALPEGLSDWQDAQMVVNCTGEGTEAWFKLDPDTLAKASAISFTRWDSHADTKQIATISDRQITIVEPSFDAELAYMDNAEEETGIKITNLKEKYAGEYAILIDGEDEPQTFLLRPQVCERREELCGDYQSLSVRWVGAVSGRYSSAFYVLQGYESTVIARGDQDSLVIDPAFNGRATPDGFTGITLGNPNATDSGIYEVLYEMEDGSVRAQYSEFHVKDGVQIEDGQLEVALEPFCHKDVDGSLSLVLRCGNFFFSSRPDDFDVSWHTPWSAEPVASTHYNGETGQFSLVVPVSAGVEGEYRCVVSPPASQKVCLGQETQEPALTVRGRDLTDTDCRLEMLEADRDALKAGQGQLEEDRDALKAGQGQLEAGQKQLEAGQGQLETDRDLLKAGLNKLQSARVSFHALNIVNPTGGGIMRFIDTPLNDGNGYDQSTGKFTVPKSGVYVIMAILEFEGQGADYDNKGFIKKNGDQIAYVWKDHAHTSDSYDDEDPTTISIVARLTKGDQVWTEYIGELEDIGDTTFSAVLIYPD